MTLELFITILVLSAAATSVAVQLVKNVLDTFKITYKSVPVAVAIALIVGVAEIFIYYGMNGLVFTVWTVIYAVCMGVANAVGATTSYDLVKKFIYTLMGKTL